MTLLPKRAGSITEAEVHRINRAAMLDLLRVSEPLLPGQIVEGLGLPVSSVMAMLDEFRRENLITVEDTSHSSDLQHAIRFHGKENLVVGIDLGGTKLYGALANLQGEIIHEIHIEQHHAQSEESFTVLRGSIQSLLDAAADTGLPVMGIGVGVPGVVSADTGSVTLAPALHWDRFPLKTRLASQFSLPIQVENDANLAALGEYWFGADQGEDDLVLLAIGTGIGAGMIIDGKIHRGRHDLAGEVGYFLPDRFHLGRSYPDFGALEQIASGTGIAERGRAALAGSAVPQTASDLTAAEVFDAARRQETWAMAVIDDAVDALALLVGALTLTLDPDVIVFGGGVSGSADLLIEPIRERLIHSLPSLPEFRASRLGFRAGILGAAALAMKSAFSD